MNEDLFEEAEDDTEASDGLDEKDKDFVKRLEKMAQEVEDEADKPK